MRLYSDIITEGNLYARLPQGVGLEASQHGSRKRARRFEITLAAEHGSDAHGIKRAYARNSGRYGGAGDYDRAATWVEWGDFIVKLFKLDPDAIIGQYKDIGDFIYQTTEYAPNRPEHENAPAHAERWAEELNEYDPANLL